MTVQSGTRLGPYEILAPIGAGGMGEVYRARDTRLGREVAIKVLPEALSADSGRLRRFEKEAQAASALNHPNIITVYDVGSSGPTSYIAMELVEGVTLRQLLADGPMSLKKLFAIASQVAEGLAKAHGVGIVHRDLKPENVMVTKDGFVKILDFGLAKLAQPEIEEGGSIAATLTKGTEPGVVMGTVGYMSPEQASAKAVDFRSDQFSLGAILYEMATGKRAFQKKTAVETLSAILNEEPEPLAVAVPSAPVPLRWIVERCLAKDQEERYASTRDLARDLARLREGISEASAPGAFAAAVSGRARRPWLVPAAIALASGVVIGVLITRKGPAPVADYHAVTFRRGTVGVARFAPDGQTIVYGAQWDGKILPELFSTRADSTEARVIGNADVASISSAGKMAVAIFRDSGPTLAEMSLAGGAPREIVEGVSLGDWAPDGRGLAVIRRNKIEFPVGKVLGAATPGTSLSSIRFSPDGRQIAAIENLRSESESSSVVVFDAASGKKRTVSSGWGFAAPGLAWHPRTGEIWFSPRDVEPGSVLMVCAVDASTGKSRVVARPPGVTVVQDIAPDGRVLLKVDDWHESVMYGRMGSNAETNFSWLDFSRVVDLSDDGKTLLLDESGRGGGARGSIYLRKTRRISRDAARRWKTARALARRQVGDRGAGNDAGSPVLASDGRRRIEGSANRGSAIRQRRLDARRASLPVHGPAGRKAVPRLHSGHFRGLPSSFRSRRVRAWWTGITGWQDCDPQPIRRAVPRRRRQLVPLPRRGRRSAAPDSRSGRGCRRLAAVGRDGPGRLSSQGRGTHGDLAPGRRERPAGKDRRDRAFRRDRHRGPGHDLSDARRQDLRLFDPEKAFDGLRGHGTSVRAPARVQVSQSRIRRKSALLL